MEADPPNKLIAQNNWRDMSESGVEVKDSWLPVRPLGPVTFMQ